MIEAHGTLWKVMEGHGKSWKVLEHYGNYEYYVIRIP
jgi:hypothetical protein